MKTCPAPELKAPKTITASPDSSSNVWINLVFLCFMLLMEHVELLYAILRYAFRIKISLDAI